MCALPAQRGDGYIHLKHHYVKNQPFESKGEV
jgi:hypothetical protein